MEINIVCVGNIKEKFFKDAMQEYIKRISAYAKVTIVECKEADYKDCNKINIEKAKEQEGEEIKKHLKGYVIALEINGNEQSSLEFASAIKSLEISGNSTISFIIGGSYGIDEKISNLAKTKLSFGKFTLPHQLIRVVLIEQIYRAFTIINNKIYHK